MVTVYQNDREWMHLRRINIIFNKILYICIANKIHHAKNKKRGN